MSKIHQHLSETHILGPRTKNWIVRVDTADNRPWLARAPVCAALRHHQIVHVGIADCAAPYRVVRLHQGGTYFMACFGGEGRVLVAGKWQRFRAGTAYLLPRYILNAFHAVPGTRWQFCWVRYQQPAAQRPIATASSPVLARFDPEPLRAAILGLHHECRGAAAPAPLHHWVELIHGYVLRFAQPLQEEDRLWQLWHNVAANLSTEWTLEQLARDAHVSAEHLRRLCHQQLRRSPMHQVIYLRMHRASELLTATDLKIETIANAVGYHNPFVFSTTFKKWIGWRPSDHRLRKQSPLG